MMKLFKNLFLLIPILWSTQCLATVGVKDSNLNPVGAATDISCGTTMSCILVGSTLKMNSLGGGSSTGSGLWEANNVGIDTFVPVGVGSTSPGQALDVQGTVRSTGLQVTATGNSTSFNVGKNVGIGSLSPDANLTVIGTGASNSSVPNFILKDVNFNPIFEVLNNGTVGVGTVSPNSTYAVDVVSNFSNNIDLLSTQSQQSFAGGGTLTLSQDGQDSELIAAGLGSIVFKGALNGTHTLGTFGKIRMESAGIANTSSAPGQMDFYTTPANSLTPVDNLIISSSGNVGIGGGAAASAQGGQLTLAGTGNVGIGTTFTTSLLDMRENVTTNVGGITIYNPTITGDFKAWEDANNVSHIDANASGNNPMVINGSGTGNVGIGTTVPGGTLEINSAINPYFLIRSTGTGGSYWNELVTDTASGIGANYLAFIPNGAGSSAATVVFNTNGNVGIGTTNPARLLDVKGTIGSLGIIDTGIAAASGTPYVCVNTSGQLVKSASACSGT